MTILFLSSLFVNSVIKYCTKVLVKLLLQLSKADIDNGTNGTLVCLPLPHPPRHHHTTHKSKIIKALKKSGKSFIYSGWYSFHTISSILGLSFHLSHSMLWHYLSLSLISADSGFLTILILLDLSAAFDTINHSILHSRLHHSVGITGTALSWFTLYLSDRHQSIAINNCKSSTSPLTRCPSRFRARSPPLHHLHPSPWTNHPSSWSQFPLLCRRHPTLPLIQDYHLSHPLHSYHLSH